jgi:UMF1 family MFS transporter
MIGLPLLFIKSTTGFWILALTLAIFIGPVQAASRSLMARLTVPAKSTEMFGLYAFSGRITAFIGPWVLGLATYHFHTQRAGMGTILVFFLIGGLLMLFVKEPTISRNQRKNKPLS